LDLLALFQPFGDAWNEWTGASVICVFCIFCAAFSMDGAAPKTHPSHPRCHPFGDSAGSLGTIRESLDKTLTHLTI